MFYKAGLLVLEMTSRAFPPHSPHSPIHMQQTRKLLSKQVSFSYFCTEPRPVSVTKITQCTFESASKEE